MGMLAHKLYLKQTYKQTENDFKASHEKRKALGLKTVPHASTIQRFFKKLKSDQLTIINNIILGINEIDPEVIAIDATGYTNEQGDIYFLVKTGKKRLSFTKNHISVDTETQLILHWQTEKGPRNDAALALPHLKEIKHFKPQYIAADKAYDSEKIRKYINEEIQALAIIPLKKNAKTGKHRLNNHKTFDPEIYSQRNLAETVNSVQKRVFEGQNKSRSTPLRNKETELKNLLYNIYRTIKLIQKQ